MSEMTVEERIAAKVAGALDNTPPAEPAATEVPEPPAQESDNDSPEPDQTELPLEPEVEPESEPLLAGRFKTAEELERGYTELTSKLAEQGAELGELRKLSSEIAALRDQMPAPAQTPGYDPGSVDEWLGDNPQQIPAMAEQAIASGDGYLYQRAIAAWQELDPVGAMDFHARKIAEAQTQALRQELQPTLDGVQRVETATQFQAAWDTAAQKHPDFAEVLNGVTQETLNGFPPQVLDVLRTGDQASKQQVLETLYRWQKAEQTGLLNQAAAQAVAAQQQQAQQARQEATVASASATADRAPTNESPVDAWREQFQQSDAFKKAAGLI